MVKRTESSHVRLRCSLRFVGDSGSPEVIGFPFARLDICGDTLAFFGGHGLPFGRPRWTIRRDQISRLERTQNGVRFYAEGFDSPWVVASLFPHRFLAKLRKHGVVVAEGPIVPSKWNSI